MLKQERLQKRRAAKLSNRKSINSGVAIVCIHVLNHERPYEITGPEADHTFMCTPCWDWKETEGEEVMLPFIRAVCIECINDFVGEKRSQRQYTRVDKQLTTHPQCDCICHDKNRGVVFCYGCTINSLCTVGKKK